MSAPPTPDDRCGTHAGARVHYRRREELCGPYREAWRAYQRAFYHRRQLVKRRTSGAGR